MKLLFLIGYLSLVSAAFAQTVISLKQAEYFVDTDPGQGNGSSFTAVDGGLNEVFEEITASLPTGAISVGIHTLSVRFRNSDNAWGSISTRAFQVMSSGNVALVPAKVSQGEFFVDTDPGTGSGTALTAVDGTMDEIFEDVTGNFNSASLGFGFHTISVRLRNSDGTWGSIHSRAIEVTTAGSKFIPLPQKTAAGEFFVDIDPGTGSGTALAAVDGTMDEIFEDVTANFNSASLSFGLHTLSVRLRNSDGTWGNTLTRTINVTTAGAMSVNAPPKLNRAEYFIDVDPGEGNATALAASDGNHDEFFEEVSLNLNTASIPEGYHLLGIRFRNSDGNWSNIFKSVFEIQNTTAPSPPNGLTATAGVGQVLLRWNASTEFDFLRYRIYGGTSPNPTVQIDSADGGSLDTVKTISGLTNGITYYYRITAVDQGFLESGYSNEVNGVPPDLTPPSAPQNLTAIAGSGQITVKWNQNSEPDFRRYRIYRSTSPNATIQIDSTSGGVTDTTKIITGLIAGTTYYFRVTAVDTSKNLSAYSNEVSAAPLDQTPPSAPQNLTATAGNAQITLKWDKNSEPDFKRYRIFRSTSPNAALQIDSTGGGITDTMRTYTGLTNGTTYYFRVTAVDDSGNVSGYSNEVNAAPTDNIAPTIFNGLLASDVVNKVRIVAGADEALSALIVSANSVNVTMVKEGDAYFNNYTLGSSGTLDLNITATDLASNISNKLKSYHVTLLNKVNIFGPYSFSSSASEGYLLVSQKEKAAVPAKYSMMGQPVEMLATGSGGEITVHASYDNKSVSSLAGYVEGKIGVYQLISEQWVYAGGQGKNGAVMSKLSGNYPVGVFYNPDHVVIPENFELHANYPNPFNPSTVISYQLSVISKVSLKIYNILGQEVRTLVDRPETAGFKSVVWDGKDAANHAVASGVYLYRLQAGDFVKTRKMLLVK